MGAGRVVMGLLFYPRGGSAYVVRYLSPALERAGWQVVARDRVARSDRRQHERDHVLRGPRRPPARRDRRGARVRARGGRDRPAPADAPVVRGPRGRARRDLRLGPARARRPPRRRVGGADGRRGCGRRRRAPPPPPDAAARRRVPLLARRPARRPPPRHRAQADRGRSRARSALAATLGETLATMPDAAAATLDGPPRGLDADEQRDPARRPGGTPGGTASSGPSTCMRQAHARPTTSCVVAREPARPRSRCSASPPTRSPRSRTASTSSASSRTPRTGGARRAAFRRWLVDDPQGWTRERPARHRCAYTEADLDRLLGPGRRRHRAALRRPVPRLQARARRWSARSPARATGSSGPASLVIWGGHPGEWEGEHPVTVAEEVGDDGIFFTGWRGHDDLPTGSRAARRARGRRRSTTRYPQVPLEAMAVGLPVIACAQRRAPVDGQPRPEPPDRLVRAARRRRRARPTRSCTVVNDPTRRAPRARERPGARPGRPLVGRLGAPVRSGVRRARGPKRRGGRTESTSDAAKEEHERRAATCRFAIVGAGMAGILSAIKLTEAGLTDFTIYEKGDRFGGTWRENTYPGLACDVPSHLYSYSFAPTPELEPPVLARPRDPRVLREGRGRARPRAQDPLRRRGHALRVRRRPLAPRHRGRPPRRGRRRDRGDRRAAPPASTPTSTGIDDFAGACFHSSRWDHDVADRRQAGRGHRHRLDRGADRRRDRRPGRAPRRCSSAPRSGSCRRTNPRVHRRGARGVLRSRPGAPGTSCTTACRRRSACSPTRWSTATRPRSSWIEDACLANLEDNVTRPGAQGAPPPELPRRVQAAHHLAELLRGDPGSRTRSW